MEHATHDPRNEKDPYAPVGAIYKLDTRTGWAEFLDLIQPIAICITRNLLHLFKVTLKTEEAIEDTKVIDAYHKDLDRREANAQKAGRVFPKTLYIALYRPTELSLQFIRWYGFTFQIEVATGSPSTPCAPSWPVTFSPNNGQGSRCEGVIRLSGWAI